MPSVLRHLFAALAGACALPAATGRAEPLTRIAQVRALSPAEAAEKRPVIIKATVTFYDPVVGLFFVQDESGDVFIRVDASRRPAPAPQPGDRLRLAGVTGPGDFLPFIELGQLEKLRSGEPTSRCSSPRRGSMRAAPHGCWARWARRRH